MTTTALLVFQMTLVLSLVILGYNIAQLISGIGDAEDD